MPAYVLVKAVDGFNPSDPMTTNRGYPVEVQDHSLIGGAQVPPRWCQIYIPDADVADVREYVQQWYRQIDWETVANNPVIDGWRIKVFAKPEVVSASGLGKIAYSNVDEWLTKWGCENINPGDNAVTFDFSIYTLLQSDGFWDAPASAHVTFTEKSYDQGTGIHEIDVTDYTLPQEYIESRIASRGGTVTVANPSKITFQIHRNSVLQEFKSAGHHKVESSPFSTRKFAFEQAEINAALANDDPESPDYATLELTRQQAALLVHNRLDD